MDWGQDEEGDALAHHTPAASNRHEVATRDVCLCTQTEDPETMCLQYS